MYTVFVLVTLGNPAAQCANYGICSAESVDPQVWERWKPQVSASLKAVLTAPAAGNVRLEFSPEAMLPDTWEQYFSSGIFRVDAPYALQPKLAQALGYAAFTVPQGIYPVIATGLGVRFFLDFPAQDRAPCAIPGLLLPGQRYFLL
ncbi:MAG: hypothetical protein JNK89_08525 [Saprospiraceae bacterium]|nr:hypothetical protein [Saprospiraceae bacterium]